MHVEPDNAAARARLDAARATRAGGGRPCPAPSARSWPSTLSARRRAGGARALPGRHPGRRPGRRAQGQGRLQGSVALSAVAARRRPGRRGVAALPAARRCV
ncbi:MAG: hypothetical protein WKG00_05430 [Polyangiaceae bacterium]